jgi:transcriptional activator SPT7
LLISPHLRSGDFADALGEDYLGLRALGIAAEFGLSNLSIPKKLLRGKKGQNKPTALVLFLFL